MGSANAGEGESRLADRSTVNGPQCSIVVPPTQILAAAALDFRRLRDEFLEAIAMAVLDQHEIETAENELKRLEHELEVRRFASANCPVQEGWPGSG